MARLDQTVRVKTDLKGFSSGMQNVNRSFGKLNRSIGAIGAAMGAAFAIGKLKAFATESLKLYDVQAKAEASLLQALNGNVDALERLKDQATQLQGITLFGDEETIKAQALLATFKLTEDQITKLIPVIQDFATVKNMDLAQAAELVGKSVGSSTNALTRYGLTMEGVAGSNQRTESAVNSLSSAFEGQAQVAAEVGTGGLTQLSNQWGDLMEQVGEIVSYIIGPFIKALKSMVTWFSGLSKTTKTLVLVFTAVLTIIPAIIAGVAAMIPVFSALSASILPIAGTVLAVIAVIAALAAASAWIYQNWDSIGKWFGNLWVKMKNGVLDAVISIVGAVGSMLDVIGIGIGDVLVAAMESLKSELPNDEDAIKFTGFGDSIKQTTEEIFGSFNKAKEGVSGFNNELGKIGKGYKKESIVELNTKQVGPLEVDAGLEVSNVLADVIPEGEIEALLDRQERVAESMDNFNRNVTASLQNAAQNALTGFGEFLGAFAMGEAGIDDFGKMMMDQIANLLKQLGEAAIAIGVGMIAIKAAFTNPFAAIAAGVALIALSAATRAAISNMGFTGAGGGNSSGGNVGVKIPGAANGAVVTGPSIMAVGEGGETEVVQPLSKLKGLLKDVAGGGAMGWPEHNIQIKGEDLYIVWERARNNNNRIG